MKIKYLLPVVAATLVLFGCSSATSINDKTNIGPEDNVSDSGISNDNVSNTNSSNEESSQDELPTEALSDDELNEFTDLFNTFKYNGFLSEGFNNPEEINWNQVIKLGAEIFSKDCNENEMDYYLKSTSRSHLQESETLYSIKKSELEDYIKRHAGKDYIPDNKDIDWVYNKETDSFYKALFDFDFRYCHYDCISGEKKGDKYTLRLKYNPEKSVDQYSDAYYGINADRIVTFSKAGDDLVFESNKIQWDDYCVPEQTFDVNLAQYDSPVHFVTYEEDPNQAEMVLEKDGKYISRFLPSFSNDEQRYNLKKVDAVGFFDFNADGMDDVAIVGDTDHGKHLFLEAASTGEYSFTSFADFGEEEAKAIGADLTINGMKAALLGDNKDGKYTGYKDAYAQIVKVFSYSNYNFRDDPNAFDLIYVDNDDIPELVVDNHGYWVSLYGFKDGHAYNIMDSWGYGAMGNYGYSYSPKNNVFYNWNTDYAGAIGYTTLFSINDEGKVVTTYWSMLINFNDIDGNEEPSEEELESADEYSGSIKYYSSDKDMSEEEIKKEMDKYESCHFEELIGTKDYNSIMEQLKN